MRVRFVLGLLLAFLLPACGDGGTDPDVLPLAPDGVAAVALTTTTAQVTWNDLSDNEAGFILQTSPDNILWTNRDAYGQNVTTGVVHGLIPGAQVFIRVASQNVKGVVPSALSATVTPPLPAWSQIEDAPADLFWTCSAFDPVQRLMYVFGGVDGGGTTHNALRILDVDATAPPTTWVSLTPASAPLPRLGSSLIYDPLGNRLILFGGQIDGATDSTDELWQFQLGTSTWSLLSVSNPPSARQHHSAVYDEGLDRMVVFGGGTTDPSTVFSDVAALSLPATGAPVWSPLTPSGTPPSARLHHSAIYDVAGRRMVVFGGWDGSSAFQDSWALDLSVASPAAWTPLTPSGPPNPRYGHVAVFDSVNRQMVVFGGADDMGVPDDQVWTLTLQGAPTWNSWTPSPTAGPRYLGTAVYDPVAVRMIVIGGIVDDFLTTTPETWSLGL